jgi:hypothetical protein
MNSASPELLFIGAIITIIVHIYIINYKYEEDRWRKRSESYCELLISLREISLEYWTDPKDELKDKDRLRSGYEVKIIGQIRQLECLYFLFRNKFNKLDNDYIEEKFTDLRELITGSSFMTQKYKPDTNRGREIADVVSIIFERVISAGDNSSKLNYKISLFFEQRLSPKHQNDEW